MQQIRYALSAQAQPVFRASLDSSADVIQLPAGGGNQVSLNVTAGEVARYVRDGDNLLITLIDGRVVVVQGYFDSEGSAANRLYLSTDGFITEVEIAGSDGGAVSLHYGTTEGWGKWSPLDELIFVDRPVSSLTALDDSFDFLVPMIGTVGLGALFLSGGGSSAPERIPPTVNDPDAVIRVGGDDPRELLITGTADPGSEVSVTIDGISVVTLADADRNWIIEFKDARFPGDGSYRDVQVTVEEPHGTVSTLDGPTYLIDTTPPQLTVEDGTVSNGDLFNAVAHAGGVTVSGTAEPGSTVVIGLDSTSRSAVVGSDGRWSFTFDTTELPAGEYTRDITVSATDSFGNRTTLSDAIQIDTVANPLMIDSVTGDDLLCSTDCGTGFAITGMSLPGTMVSVSFAGITQDVLTGPDGVWSMPIAPDAVPNGEYDATVTATTVDAAGNSTTTTATVRVDTVTTVTLTNLPLTGDDVINASELTAGVMFTGTSEAGSTVMVTIGALGPATFAAASGVVVRTSTVSEDGTWSVMLEPAVQAVAGQRFAAASEPGETLRPGTYGAFVNVVATDAAGNTASASHGFRVDTETTVSINTGLVEGDGTVNAAERADGIVVTGSGEPGATVVLSVEGAQFSAVVGGTGDWSVTLPAEVLPEGVYRAALAATATDIAGNVAVASGSLSVDTQTMVSVDTDGVEGDGVVNAIERADGVTLTGQAEAGARVQVTLGAITHATTAAADGSWTRDFAAAEIPSGERLLTVTAVATDAAGNSATASDTLIVDTLVRNFASTMVPGGVDRIVNAAEAAQGINLGGTTEPGSSVTVTLAGVEKVAQVSADGSWSVTFTPGQLPSGELTALMRAVATDAAGNTETITGSVRFDTDAGVLTIDSTPVEGDDVVNFAEASDGVVLTGTSNPGQIVHVTMAGVTLAVATDAAGNWRAPFSASDVAPGTYMAQITATITDTAGNTLTRSDSVRVDTEVVNFAFSTVPVEGDGIVNAREAEDGVRLTGTTEPGATVAVTFGGRAYAAEVDAAGNWLVNIPGAAIPRGETLAPVVATTTDLAGNIAQLTSALTIDTQVNRLALDEGLFTADGVLNSQEADLGLTLAGKVEAGSTLVVTLGGVPHVAAVDPAGNWTVAIPGQHIPRGTLDAVLLVEATDLAGNTRSMTQSVAIDTDKPGAPIWVDYTRNHTGLTSITLDTVAHGVEIGHLVAGPGGASVVDLGITGSFDLTGIGTYYRFDGSVADGSHLVVSYSDNAGNQSGALLVTDDTATNALTFTDQLAQALRAFDVELIDLRFAEDTDLSITEQQIQALSSTTDTVTVRGGSDDSVNVRGASLRGTTEVDGHGFNVYTLGDATILIDEDITKVHTGVV
jgi:large repetitive protein